MRLSIGLRSPSPGDCAPCSAMTRTSAQRVVRAFVGELISRSLRHRAKHALRPREHEPGAHRRRRRRLPHGQCAPIERPLPRPRLGRRLRPRRRRRSRLLPLPTPTRSQGNSEPNAPVRPRGPRAGENRGKLRRKSVAPGLARRLSERLSSVSRTARRAAAIEPNRAPRRTAPSAGSRHDERDIGDRGRTGSGRVGRVEWVQRA
jgi:hypothetical protein